MPALGPPAATSCSRRDFHYQHARMVHWTVCRLRRSIRDGEELVVLSLAFRLRRVDRVALEEDERADDVLAKAYSLPSSQPLCSTSRRRRSGARTWCRRGSGRYATWRPNVRGFSGSAPCRRAHIVRFHARPRCRQGVCHSNSFHSARQSVIVLRHPGQCRVPRSYHPHPDLPCMKLCSQGAHSPRRRNFSERFQLRFTICRSARLFCR